MSVQARIPRARVYTRSHGRSGVRAWGAGKTPDPYVHTRLSYVPAYGYARKGDQNRKAQARSGARV